MSAAHYGRSGGAHSKSTVLPDCEHGAACIVSRHVVGILAELERSLIQERTKAGRAAAQARGVKMGRKPLLSAQQVAHAR